MVGDGEMEEAGWTETARNEGDRYENGECPSRVLDAISQRGRPDADIIVFANEKGGVGKSTLAFHTAVRLAEEGRKVLTIDLDYRQKSMSSAIAARSGTASCLGAELAIPRHCVIDKPSGSLLLQEMFRLGGQCDAIVIDCPGSDSGLARRAIALATTLVTPINASHFDCDVLAHFHAASGRLEGPGAFGQTVLDLRAEQKQRGQRLADWIVVKNRVRTLEKAQIARIDDQLARLADRFGLRTGEGLREGIAYRELLPYGLLRSDLKRIAELDQFSTRDNGELDEFIATLALPDRSGMTETPSSFPSRSRTLRSTRERYAQSLRASVAGKLAVA
ncbi:division plane positioning ATPase MipZ [Qipengyuania sp. JC766]|uniref:division plane positioning ATPase MipZ n=1 Tax=Qipengyuania sp. JC766 TaxID=3232139 RepID=UPI0034574D8E